MFIVIESAIGGDSAGYLNCTVTGSELLSTLIANYCESKVCFHSPV